LEEIELLNELGFVVISKNEVNLLFHFFIIFFTY